VQVQNILEVVNPNGKFIVLLAVNDLIAGHGGSQWEILLKPIDLVRGELIRQTLSD